MLKDINYITYGKGKDVILLHGWGQNIEMMKPLGDGLINKRVTIIDLPGFGKSKISKALSLDEYVGIIHEVVKTENIKKPIIIGHSFGGKLAIMYSAKYEVSKTILLGPTAFRSDEKPLKKKLFKILKSLPLINKLEELGKQLIGSTDYKNASPVMREVLVKHLTYDAGDDASKIKVPTLIFWGKQEQAIDYKTVIKLNNLIKDSALIETVGTHYAYLEYLGYYLRVINEFLKEDK